MKQTAVEFIIDYFENPHFYKDKEWIDIKEQAKEMEKQHIKHAWDNGAYGGGQFMQIIDDAEQYYNETYGSKGSANSQNTKQ